jgi:glycosyltransferase involved in cell wall biosynthesis
MKTLTLVTEISRPDRAALLRGETAGDHPRVLLFEDRLNSDMLAGNALRTAPVPRRWVYRLVGRYAGQVLEAYRRRRSYDAVLSWGEPLSLFFALLLKLTGSRTRHIALMYWISPPKKALLLRVVHSHIDRIITWSSVQRAFAIDQLHIPASKITLVLHPVDLLFWNPIDAPADMICAVGNEMRDYATLIAAMRGLDIPCHIAAKVIPAGASHKMARISAIAAAGPLPPNVTVGPRSYRELRALYARCRFVVIPLLPTDTDNGVRAALESMAMGKAVICSRVEGQVDVIVDKETGLLVPQGDPGALREAIVYLWSHPEVADAMGRSGRRRVEERHSFEQFVDAVKGVVEETMRERVLQPA